MKMKSKIHSMNQKTGHCMTPVQSQTSVPATKLFRNWFNEPCFRLVVVKTYVAEALL